MVQCNSTTLPTRITCHDTEKLCGNNFCYDPATQICSETGSIVTCINTCGQKCYDSASQVCINGTVCTIGEDLCEVKYENSSGSSIDPLRLQCYNPRSQRCLNHTLCYEKDRVCNGQCILNTSSYQYQVCANDNVTLCDIRLFYNNYNYNYRANQIQVCNGSCYDTQMGLKRCVNDALHCVPNSDPCGGQCISDSKQVCANDKRTICNFTSNSGDYPRYQMHICNGTCFDTSLQQCINGSVSCIDDICDGQCYNSVDYKCLNGAVCLNNRICGEQCIRDSKQVCANDKRTVCNVTSYYNNNRRYQMHICNGTCFDTSIQQCINGNVSCIDDICDGQCYNSARHVCLNNTLCSFGQELCEVKYNSSSGNPIEPIQLKCYNPQLQRCLNHTLCYEIGRVCNGQCILKTSSYPYQVCANDNVTLCDIRLFYNNYNSNYKSDQIQVCNGSCYDTQMGLKRCVNDSVQYHCSNNLYNATTHECVKGVVCLKNRVCGSECIRNNYQVCVDGRRICNVTSSYDKYQPGQIKLCVDVCYDSSSEQCVPRNINSSITTTPSTSTSTINNISFYAGTNTSSFSTSTSATNFSTSTSVTNFSTNTSVTNFSTNTSVTNFSTSTSATNFSTNTSVTNFSTSTSATNFSTSTRATNSSIVTSNAEVSPSSITLATTTSTNSPSTSTSLTPLLTTHTDFSTESSSSETKTTTSTTAFSTARSSFTRSLSSSASSEGANISSTSSDTTSYSTLATTGADRGASITSNETSSSTSSHSSNSSTLTTESSSQTTPSFTPTLPSQGSSCAAKECTNDTGCCVPHVERRCHHQNRTRVSSQTCKAIVIGEDNNNSFVIAIVINDKEVLVINSNHFFLLLLSMAITVLLLLLIKTCFVIVIYRKKIAITFRLWYLSVKKYSTESQRKQWEKC